MLRLRPLRLLPLRLQPLAWGGVRRGAWRAQSGVRRGAQRAQSGVRCGAQVQLPVQVRLPAQLSNSTGSAKSLIEPATQPPVCLGVTVAGLYTLVGMGLVIVFM